MVCGVTRGFSSTRQHKSRLPYHVEVLQIWGFTYPFLCSFLQQISMEYLLWVERRVVLGDRDIAVIKTGKSTRS